MKISWIMSVLRLILPSLEDKKDLFLEREKWQKVVLWIHVTFILFHFSFSFKKWSYLCNKTHLFIKGWFEKEICDCRGLLFQCNSKPRLSTEKKLLSCFFLGELKKVFEKANKIKNQDKKSSLKKIDCSKDKERIMLETC